MSKPIYGPDSDPLSAEEFGKVRATFLLLHIDDEIVVHTGAFRNQFGGGFFASVVRRSDRSIGPAYAVYESQADVLRPADQATAEALGRKPEPALWGPDSAPLTEEEARRLPNIASILVDDGDGYSHASFIGLDLRLNVVAEFDLYRGCLNCYEFHEVRPADESCARDCGRLEQSGEADTQAALLEAVDDLLDAIRGQAATDQELSEDVSEAYRRLKSVRVASK